MTVSVTCGSSLDVEGCCPKHGLVTECLPRLFLKRAIRLVQAGTTGENERVTVSAFGKEATLLSGLQVEDAVRLEKIALETGDPSRMSLCDQCSEKVGALVDVAIEASIDSRRIVQIMSGRQISAFCGCHTMIMFFLCIWAAYLEVRVYRST